METQPLMTFKSRIAGKNADVNIYADRIEWGHQTRFTKSRSDEMIPVRSISSVTSGKDGLTNYKVSVITAGNTIDFRTSRNLADQAKNLLSQLMLGHVPQPGPTPNAPEQHTTPEPVAPQPEAPVQAGSTADELTKLAALRDQGVLSPEEFETQKARLLQ